MAPKTLPILAVLMVSAVFQAWAASETNIIVDTGQDKCYGNNGSISFPGDGQPFYGQDAEYAGNVPAYSDNGDGTITDLNTGLMWSKSVDSNKSSLVEATNIASGMDLAGYHDWRVPNIKELYSLIDFRGNTGFSGNDMSSVPADAIPYIDTDYFDFRYGQTENGERYIDAQWLSSTEYVSTTMNGQKTLFGVNFADGRIKGYGYEHSRRGLEEKKFYVRYVRGNKYGVNDFVDNADGTVTDMSTGLIWMKADSGKAMSWQDALSYAANLTLAGYDDWRLPDAKELQYIVDYTRSPDTTGSPAISPVFLTTSITNEAGQKDYPYFWTSTTHLDGHQPGAEAAYVAFGRALGKMNGRIIDVHGAGAQRSDPKTGSPTSRGPQGDIVRIWNYVRCVRGGSPQIVTAPVPSDRTRYPYNIKHENTAQKANRPQNNRRSNGDQDRSAGGPGRNGGMPGFVSHLDKNGDGKVSRSEFDGPPDKFDELDRNVDGYLSEDERPAGPPSRGGRMQ
jgi:hypothetical protein